MENKFVQEVKAMSPWLKEVFFQIHRNPELGNEEYKTQALILSELEKMGVKGEKIIGRITAHTVFSRPTVRSVSTFGTIVTWNGSSISMMMPKNRASRPRKRKRLRA